MTRRATSAADDEIRRRLRSLVDAQCETGAPSCILRVETARRENPWSFAAGTISRADHRRVHPASPFRTASVTKMFTAVAAAQLADESLIGLDDAVTDHLPPDVTGVVDDLMVVDGRSCGHAVTIRHLLDHSSGLDDHAASDEFLGAISASPLRPWTARALLDQARRSSPAPSAPDRGRFRYSDTGYVVVGLMLEHVCRAPLATVLRRRVIEPLGLADTWLEGYEAPPRGDPTTHPYLDDVDTMVIHGSADWAAGGLVSTAADLCRFIRALIDGHLTTASTKQEMVRYRAGRLDAHQRRHGLTGYGLGVEIRERAGRTLVGHIGLWGSFAYLDAATGTAFAGTVNHAGDDVHRFLDEVVAIVGERSERPPIAMPHT